MAVGEARVYVLQLENGNYYVGTSCNVPGRIDAHFRGEAAVWTRAHKPVAKVDRITDVQGDTDAAELWETLAWMQRCGVDRVRGSLFTTVHLSVEDRRMITRLLRDRVGTCRRCGDTGHFVRECVAPVEDTEAHSTPLDSLVAIALLAWVGASFIVMLVNLLC